MRDIVALVLLLSVLLIVTGILTLVRQTWAKHETKTQPWVLDYDPDSPEVVLRAIRPGHQAKVFEVIASDDPDFDSKFWAAYAQAKERVMALNEARK